ncbi:type II toxin-antitoxin system HicA family toxin [Enterococcus sp. AZ196]
MKVDQSGSHMKLYNSKTKTTTIVPNHKGDIPIGLNSPCLPIGILLTQ